MGFIVGLIVGILFGFCLPVVIACLFVAGESNRENEEAEKQDKYTGW